MDFEITAYVRIEDYMFDEMIDLVKKGETFERAYTDVTMGLDDCDYFLVDYAQEEIVKELKKRYEEKGV